MHYGHLKTVEYVSDFLALEWVEFVVSARPPHRQAPVASATHRFAMLERALDGYPRFRANNQEIRRRGPSYTVWTLRALKAQNPDHALYLILGADAFESVPTWYRWEELLVHAHIALLCRPGWDLSESRGYWCRDRLTTDPEDLRHSCAGKVLVSDAPLIDISASSVRTRLARGEEVSRDIPVVVYEYIIEHGLYSARHAEVSKTHAI